MSTQTTLDVTFTARAQTISGCIHEKLIKAQLIVPFTETIMSEHVKNQIKTHSKNLFLDYLQDKVAMAELARLNWKKRLPEEVELLMTTDWFVEIDPISVIGYVGGYALTLH